MIGRIWAIALNTFREASRKKALYAILVAVVGLNLLAIALGEMSLHEEARVVRDVGLAAMSFCGAAAAIVLGVLLLYAEIQKKTVHTILSKPIERWEFVLGKYAGMALTLTVLVALFALALVKLLTLQGVPLEVATAKAVTLAYLEILVVAAVAVFFSSFSTPILSGVFTTAIWFIGRVTPELSYAARRAKSEVLRAVAQVALKIIPDLDTFAISGGQLDGKHVSVHGEFVTWGYVGTAGLYALAWTALLLLCACVFFRRRDFV